LKGLAKLKELDRMLYRKETVEWENKVLLEGELDILRDEIDRMIEEYKSVHGKPPPNLLMLPSNESPDFDDSQSCSSSVPPKSDRQHFFLSVPYAEGKLRRSQSKLSTIESVDNLSDSSFTTVSEPLLAMNDKNSIEAAPSQHRIDLDDKTTTDEALVETKDISGQYRTAINRNKAIARCWGRSSLTEEEEARIAMLLEGDDAVGNDESITKSLLQDECYGGREEYKWMKEVDRKLVEKGYCDDNDYVMGEVCIKRSERVLVDLAEQRLLREKQRLIDDALRQLDSFPLSFVVHDGGPLKGGGAVECDEGCTVVCYSDDNTKSTNSSLFPPTYTPISQEDIHLMVDEAKVELEEEGVEIACREDIMKLLSEIKRQFGEGVSTSMHSERAAVSSLHSNSLPLTMALQDLAKVVL